MNKLVIAATMAAVTFGVYANTCVTSKVKDECGGVEVVTGAGTAHKIAISLKTTKIKNATKKVQCEDALCMYWREQGTKKINGLIWAELDDCTGCTATFEGQKYALWDDNGMIDAEFAIGVGKIGKGTDSKKIESYGSIVGDDFGELAFGAFGTLSAKTTKVECEDDDCSAWVKSLTGGIAGKLRGPAYDDTCADCDPIEYEGCCDDLQLEDTAAYGTIKITYDSSLAKKVAVLGDDDDVIGSIVKGVPADFESSDLGAEVAE